MLKLAKTYELHLPKKKLSQKLSHSAFKILLGYFSKNRKKLVISETLNFDKFTFTSIHKEN